MSKAQPTLKEHLAAVAGNLGIQPGCRPSFEQARALREAEEAFVEQQCARNRAIAERDADLAHSRNGRNSVWYRGEAETLKPIDRLAARDGGCRLTPKR